MANQDTYVTFEPEPGQNERIEVPRGPLLGALGLVVLSFTLAVTARSTGYFKIPEPVSVPEARRALRFEDAKDGGIFVYDNATDSLIINLPAGYNGFARGALRALARKRMLASVPDNAPFVLTLWRDGRLTLDDPSTRDKIEISSFGPVQIESFMQFLVPDPSGRIMGIPAAGTPASKAFTAPMKGEKPVKRLGDIPPNR
ncbi:MAG: photosynthetic complex assembly protein PuhC [Gemmatimonadaceae bacterium]|nr:photosynthetic complex assembly protein PuhC [Gemmatimonadaceae bacterium]